MVKRNVSYQWISHEAFFMANKILSISCWFSKAVRCRSLFKCSKILKIEIYATRCYWLFSSSGPPEKKMGIKASNTAEVCYVQCFVIHVLPCITVTYFFLFAWSTTLFLGQFWWCEDSSWKCSRGYLSYFITCHFSRASLNNVWV